MAEILVLVDHVDGNVRKTTNELLTIARRLGAPSAAYIGAGDAPVDALKKFGAEKVAGSDDQVGRGRLAAPCNRPKVTTSSWSAASFAVEIPARPALFLASIPRSCTGRHQIWLRGWGR